MRSIIGNSDMDPTAEHVVSFGPFRLHVAERRIERDGSAVHLGGRALDILIALIEQAGTVVGKNELMARVWPNVTVDEGSLRVHVAALRKALGDGKDGARYLTTVSGQGYCFVARLSRPSNPKSSLMRPSCEPQHNLPALPMRLVGRDQTICDIADKLRGERFVTIVGPGGIGKTTVAISAGHALLGEFAGAVSFLDLGAIHDAALVPDVVASTLGLMGQSEDPSDGLVQFLRNKRMLLVLDCCEHVIENAAALAERLYREAPRLHILATSRESLRVEGEHIHRLLPLPSPPDHASLTATQALAFPSVQLFVERASASSGQFELSDADAPLVCELCRRLDGIALAIELAASRVGAYGVKHTIELLNDKFKLLWEGRRTGLPRHQTLRATMDWSYNLLSELERIVLRRLSVFAGNFTLEAACSVAGSDDADDSQVMAALANLVAKSMLTASATSSSTRYRLLDTTRAYALEKLAASADSQTTARRHACYFLHLLERIGDQSSETLTEAADQFGNIRAALMWCFSERGERAIGVALAVASMPLFLELSLLTECQLWATRAIEALDDGNRNARRELKLRAALGLALMLTKGTTSEVGALFTTALRLAEDVGDVASQLCLVERLHLFHMTAGNFGEALDVAKRGEAAASKANDPVRLAHMQVALGISHHLAGEAALARFYVEAALSRLAVARPGIHGQLSFDYPSRARITLARILWLQGYPDQAVEIARAAVADAIRVGHPVKLSRALLWSLAIFVWNWDTENFEEYVDRLLLEAGKHSLAPYQAVGEGAKGMAMMAQGRLEAGIDLLRGAMEKMRNHRYGPLTDFRIQLAEGLAALGKTQEALDTIDQAIAHDRPGKYLFNMPEMLRVKAEVLIATNGAKFAQAESCLEESLDLARRQSALAWELRTATSLARLWMAQGRYDEAREVLAPVYVRFSEGFGRRDLKAAGQLLDQLASLQPNVWACVSASSARR
ncbi:winged helix-turn-helix domain-containing protein [Bradyrhizobium sp. ARR65]|uniref:ATP-binding protein n=1 Tax=Bradyrhizobium sp. ARR65 TaxID=1040989 RepID=UPI0005536090|nr:winged helix-turn-helix domain-containing protein [Bradyrhizobium sp. ARR65]